MAIKYTTKNIKAMIEAIDQDHESAEAAALAALEAAEAVIEERAQWAVVGQLCATKERSSVPPSDPEAIKVALAFYSTEGEARKACESMWWSTASGDSFRVWAIPVFWGTPAEFHKERKAKYVTQQSKMRADQQERMQASIEKHRAAMLARAEEYREKELAA